LQSAEAMKAAIASWNRLWKKAALPQRAPWCWPVKGDVHDIGNLVDIILTNNGYKVINLGIRRLTRS
jgi:5-methyltetrahydrofolate--homocysteine methyltransferase